MDEELYWIWLSQIRDIGPVKQKNLLTAFKTPKEIYEVTKSQLIEIPGIHEIAAEKIILSRSLESAKKIQERIWKQNIRLLNYDDPLYLSRVKKLSKSPILFYYRGDIRDTSQAVGIVGARKCSQHGKRQAIEAATYLANQNIPVISGLSKGIDGYAHTACIKAGGYTIAILACGVDLYYPSDHRELMDKIIETGAVLSKHPPKTTVHPKHFPLRNYLISAWSSKLLIIESDEKRWTL